MPLLQRLPTAIETEHLLQLMVGAVENYAIYLLDKDGTVISWNIGAERNKGYTAAEIVGSNYSRFFTEEDIAAGKPRAELEEAEHTGRFREEGWRVRKGGARFWADVTLTALRDRAGRTVGFAKITRDLSEHRANEEALREAKEHAEAANEAKSNFLANMSHELRTPLSAVLGFAELLQREMFGSLSTDQNREYAGHIHAAGSHLLAVINDILDVSKLDARALQLALEDADLSVLASDAVELMQVQAQKDDISLELDAPCEVRMRCDPRRIHQILFNLLSNALKFTPDGGRVTLSIADRGDKVAVTVADTGIGMKPEDIPRALVRFGQIENGLSRRYQGSGLGLPLVEQLVQMHGGSLDIESEPGSGTRVTVTLPKN